MIESLRGKILVVVFCDLAKFSFVHAAIPVADPLTQARNSVENHDTAEAQRYYGMISFKDAAWVDKSEDAMRWLLLQGKPESAWRIAMLLKRTGRPVPKLDYYTKLSALLGGACPLGEVSDSDSFEDLVRAYAARYYQKYLTAAPELTAPMERADDGRDVSYLNGAQVPFLEDVRRVKLLRGSGCRFQRGRLETKLEAETAELRYLLTYIDRVKKHPEQRIKDDERVRVRLLELATRLQYFELSERLGLELAPLVSEVWLGLSETDRRFLWSSLQATDRVPPGVVKVNSSEDQLIETILFDTKETEISQWLALVDLDHWSVSRREKLYDYLDRLPPFSGKGHILIRRALLAYEEGKIKEALGFLRRILISSELTVDDNSLDEVQGMALRLVQEILNHYQYDDTILAAVQSTVPTTEWRRIYRGLLLEHALIGDSASYLRLRGDLLAGGFKRTGPRLSDEAIHVLDAMASRNLKDLRKSIFELNRTNHGELRRMMRDLALQVSAMNDQDFAAARGVLSIFLPFLEGEKDRGRELQVTTDLIRTFSRRETSVKDIAAAAIEGGVTHAGAANLRPVLVLKNPFQWHALNRLPLQPLLAVPEKSTNRVWVVR